MADSGTGFANTSIEPTSPWIDPTPRKLLRKPIFAGYCVILVFFVGLGAWAATAHISSAAVAFGVVSPESSRKTVQHLEGGIIAEILVEDGDQVEMGQPLVVLEETQAMAGFQLLEGERRLLTARLTRLLTEQLRKDELAFPEWLELAQREDPDLREMLAAQRDLFNTRREVHRGRKAIGAKRIDELREEISGLESQIVNQRRQLELLDEEIAMKQNLYEKGMVPRSDLLNPERMKAEIQADISESSAGVARAKQAIGETELLIVNDDARRMGDIVNELAETRSKLASVEERLFAQRDVLERKVVTAPESGVIVQLRFHTTGGVVGPGQAILDIVPQNTRLLIDTRVRPVDIDEVAIGQEARVSFLALVDRRMPQIKGTVTRISADSLRDEMSGEHFYRARVEVSVEELAKLGEGKKITPGMPAEVLIVTGERTFLQYLVQPLSDSLRRAFRES